MAWQGFHSLKQQDATSLRLVNSLVEALLAHEPMLPPELRAKLDTYHADLANAIETKGSSGKATTRKPEASPEGAGE